MMLSGLAYCRGTRYHWFPESNHDRSGFCASSFAADYCLGFWVIILQTYSTTSNLVKTIVLILHQMPKKNPGVPGFSEREASSTTVEISNYNFAGIILYFLL